MKYIYLTEEFLGSAAALQRLVAATPDHEPVAVLLLTRAPQPGRLWPLLRSHGPAYVLDGLARRHAYRPVQALARLLLRLRGRPTWATTVAAAARRLGVPLVPVERIDAPETVALIRRLAPELIVSVYFGQRLPAAVLRLVPRGGINVHPSLLPEFAGRAPTVTALALGRAVVGVTVHRMNERLDAGDILQQRRVAVRPRETVLELDARLLDVGVEALAAAMDELRRGAADPRPQDLARRSYQSAPSPATLRRLRARGRRLLGWRDFIRVCLVTLDPGGGPRGA